MFNRYNVNRIDSDGRYEDWRELETVLKEFAKRLKLNIKISIPHNEASPAETEPETLIIKVYSTPDEYTERVILKTAYGIHLNYNQEDALIPTEKNSTVYDKNGHAVAEFGPGYIFVLFDLAHGPQSGDLMRFVLEDYELYIASMDPQATETFASLMNKRLSEITKHNFINIFNENLENQERQLAGKISSLDESIRGYQQKIVESTREMRTATQKVKLVKGLIKGNNIDVINAQFEELNKLSVTGSVMVTNNTIRVPVGQIEIEFDSVVYDIGEFEVILYTDGDYGGVRCFNRTRVVDDYFHPHITDDGDCCLGNISENIATLVGEMEYAVAVQLMIMFLRTCNSEGWYHEVTDWPIKGEENSSDSTAEVFEE